MHYTCIACVTIDFVMRMDKRRVHLEECKYRVKKIQMSSFIKVELESDSDSDSDLNSVAESVADSDFE